MRWARRSLPGDIYTIDKIPLIRLNKKGVAIRIVLWQTVVRSLSARCPHLSCPHCPHCPRCPHAVRTLSSLTVLTLSSLSSLIFLVLTVLTTWLVLTQACPHAQASLSHLSRLRSWEKYLDIIVSLSIWTSLFPSDKERARDKSRDDSEDKKDQWGQWGQREDS